MSIWSWLAGAGETIVNAAGDVLGVIPGADPLYQAMKDVVEGPLRDFANTTVGATVLRAVSGAFTGGLSQLAFVGPQLATVAWAVPGVIQGDDFDKAWFAEVRYRAEKSAELLGYGHEVHDIVDGVEKGVQKLSENFETHQRASWTPRQLGAAAGIREDAAGLALSVWNREPFNQSAFDLETGRERSTFERAGEYTVLPGTFDPRGQLPGGLFDPRTQLPVPGSPAPSPGGAASTMRTVLVVGGLAGIGVALWVWR